MTFASDREQECWKIAGATSLFPFQMHWAHQWLTRDPWGIEGSGGVALTEPHISSYLSVGEDWEVPANGVQLQLPQATAQGSTKSDVV